MAQVLSDRREIQQQIVGSAWLAGPVLLIAWLPAHKTPADPVASMARLLCARDRFSTFGSLLCRGE
ncbi:MAG: hypothetical protein ABR604_04065 [Jatrophihabitantaceae bacterium]